jgi:integrase
MDILEGAQDQRATKGAYSMARRRWQEGTVYLRKNKTRPDAWWGRYVERFTKDGTEKRVQRNKRLGDKGAITKPAAKRALKAFVDKANDYQPAATRPQLTGKASTFFSEFAAVWLEKGVVDKKASTKYGMECHIRGHLIPAFGTTRMGDIDSEKVQSFVNKLAEGRSPKTVKAVWMTLHVMWKSAKAWEYVERDLFVTRPKITDEEMRWYSDKEVRRILANAKGEDQTLLWLLAETGMRAGEVTALAANDVDLGNRVVYVKKSLWHGEEGDTKSKAGRRRICISSLLADHLSKHQAGRTEGYLFRDSRGDPWDTDEVREQRLNPILKRVGIPKIDEELLAQIVGNGRTVAQATISEKRQASVGLHSFRHTNATAMDTLSIPKGVQKGRLGHSNRDITAHYTHAFTENERDAAEKLGEFFGKNWPEPEPDN